MPRAPRAAAATWLPFRSRWGVCGRAYFGLNSGQAWERDNQRHGDTGSKKKEFCAYCLEARKIYLAAHTRSENMFYMSDLIRYLNIIESFARLTCDGCGAVHCGTGIRVNPFESLTFQGFMI